MASWFRGFIASLATVLVVQSTVAQDVRIYTTVRDRSTTTAGKFPDQRSLMLFHANKVYDYIEPAQEVTVFEPVHKRFIVYNLPRQLRCEVTLEEIRQFLVMAEEESQKRLTLLDQEIPAAKRKSLELLQFQLQPEFTSAFDTAKSQLTLTNPRFQYVVTGFTPPTSEIADNYLYVADWMAQFNAVLHPQSLMPAPRMKLNQELRTRGLVPSTVELQASTEPGLHLQAQHEWTWNLQKTDRQMIDDWEKQMQNPTLRTLSFRHFQHEMLKK